ncbi:MAG: histidinol dehydrogenase, partial [Myxococcaceae bacterium]|nr:histidinol dehydrogenase [Myxococcaceae bacterium]
LVRFRGALSSLPAASRAALLDRSFSTDARVAATVSTQLAEVRAEGDAALRRYARDLDRVSLEALEVPRAELERALSTLDPVVRRGLERAAKNLELVARASLPAPSEVEVEPGLVVGRRADPFARVGVYAPGGKAAYPSSVLMGVVPARAAGVKDVVVCSPPGPSGLPSDVVLAAAALSGATRVFAIGGAGAIGAMAYGTATVPRVDRIVGPGNAWVAEAKRQVAGDVGIDSPAGPSEILVVADGQAAPDAVARELLAQAEHDVDACVVALCLGEALAAQVTAALEAALPGQPRRATIETALRTRGAVLTLQALDEAWPFVEAFAAEHLQLNLADAEACLPKVRNAGTIFVGATTSVAFGDYLTGANHVLPTAGAGRRFSGLSVLDFVRWQTWQRVTPAAAAAMSQDVVALATSEGLPAHAAAAAALADARSAPPKASLRTRPTLRPIERYVPRRPPCELDLTDNTNLFGVPPAVARLLASPPPAAITRYPSPYADALRGALATARGVRPDEVVTGCGSDDVLDATFRAFGEPGDAVAFCPPTFGIITAFARANGLAPRPTALDVDALAASGARVIYLCSPNNPTGALLPEGFVEALLGRTSAVVVLDEAYVEYAARASLAARAPALERLLVVRTLSKAWGLAGLRLGYAVGSAALVEQVEKTRGPYKVGGLAEACALAALSSDGRWVDEGIAAVRASRAAFVDALTARGFAPLPSEANFVLVPIPPTPGGGARPAADVADRMRAFGVSVRAFPALPGLGEAVRISVGPDAVMRRCLDALVEATR